MNCIKTIRAIEGVTLENLADKTQLSIGYLSHLENGSRNNPSKETMEKIAMAFKRSVPEVFYPKDEMITKI